MESDTCRGAICIPGSGEAEHWSCTTCVEADADSKPIHRICKYHIDQYLFMQQSDSHKFFFFSLPNVFKKLSE